MSISELNELQSYSACDISDALLKLEPQTGQPPRGGFLDGIVPLPHLSPSGGNDHIPRRSAGPAFTVLFASKPGQASEHEHSLPPSNIPAGEVWSDQVPAVPPNSPHLVVVVSQPSHHRCAALGGLHAKRLAFGDTAAIVVDGRVRDVATLKAMVLAKPELVERGVAVPIFTKGTSTVASGAETVARAVQVPVQIGGVVVNPGDIVMADEIEGAVVRVPKDLLTDVLAWLKQRGDKEDLLEEFIENGGSVKDGLAKFRK